eukprot:3277152-Rhodomonas_salina.2
MRSRCHVRIRYWCLYYHRRSWTAPEIEGEFASLSLFFCDSKHTRQNPVQHTRKRGRFKTSRGARGWRCAAVLRMRHGRPVCHTLA